MKVQDTTKPRDGVGDVFTEGGLLLDHLVRVAGGARTHELVCGMELTAQHSQHIHARHRFAMQQNGDVVPVHFEADRFFEGQGAGLMRGLLQHGGKAKKLARCRLVDNDLLVVFVHGGEADSSGDHDVGLPVLVADLVYALAGSEFLDLDLSGQDGHLLIVQQSKERNALQYFWVARHQSPRPVEVDRARSLQSIS